MFYHPSLKRKPFGPPRKTKKTPQPKNTPREDKPARNTSKPQGKKIPPPKKREHCLRRPAERNLLRPGVRNWGFTGSENRSTRAAECSRASTQANAQRSLSRLSVSERFRSSRKAREAWTSRDVNGPKSESQIGGFVQGHLCVGFRGVGVPLRKSVSLRLRNPGFSFDSSANTNQPYAFFQGHRLVTIGAFPGSLSRQTKCCPQKLIDFQVVFLETVAVASSKQGVEGETASIP